MQQNPVIGRLISELDLSEIFKEMSFSNDFRTLADILNWPMGILLLHEGFTYHHYQEIRILLSQKKPLQQLKVL